uniref:Uncharacterized protein n=1 Tax=Medicago truncatula TaxID=3880 RepID=A2Q4C6_MEDTR|nr:hypothetical protein MtrDRAFT_AC157472g14v2 [Medicago truncatula]
MHLITSFRFRLEGSSSNVPANTFHLHREDSSSAVLEHRRQPLGLIDRHGTDQYEF